MGSRLFSPQCRPPAILHLCQTCDVSALFYDGDYTELASMTSVEGVKSNYFLKLFKISDVNSPLDLGKSLSALALGAEQHRQVHESTVAYIRHTSGTSTGLPKTIPQSHRAAVGVLPCLDGSRKATWTTTPLYHGGVSDCFRAWTSGGLIWLFPGKEVPITAANVLKSFRCARSSALPAIKYFSSVPYVLQMVAAEEAGLEMLRQMDLVGVGGAALPREIGKDLVEQGVCLVSRYGNTECGFLLSSHRDYSADKEWDYLRRSSSFLKFEQNDSGLAELIILRDWPHMAKRNRDDGSYATADLFEAHSNIPDAWRYHSRADSQLTLITGKKFDSAPLEDAIAASNFVKDVLIFGNGQRYPGALLFRSETAVDMSPEKYLDEVWPRIEQLNSEGQGHTRLSRSMLIVMPNGAPALEKSSKGTVLRKQAEEIYKSEINQAYSGNLSEKDSGNHAQKVDVPDHDVALTVLNIVKDAMGTQANIPKDQDLFSFGVDSAACMQIRASLQNVCSFLKDAGSGC